LDWPEKQFRLEYFQQNFWLLQYWPILPICGYVTT
jgi:hypothetical protein